MFEEYSEEAINTARFNIYKHILRDFNNRGQLGSGKNMYEMPKDLKGIIFYEMLFESVIWNGCDFTNASGNGTIFKDNDFYLSKLNNVSMQYCNFSDDVFQRCAFEGSNFANSSFTHCAIQDSRIHGCSFLGAEFYLGILRNTSISSSNFELCHFKKVLLENLDLRQLTLNYTFFDDVIMRTVCLPFFQVPFTFNGLQYVFNTSDDIKISSYNSKKKEIELAEYKDLIKDFIIFFNEQNRYFPLTNCYIVENKMELAIECNKTGIMKSAALHDFRSLYFYCIQASQILKISKEKRGLIYSEINALLSNACWTPGEYHQFYLYFPMIKRLLFDVPTDNTVMTLTIHTNIEPTDYNKLAILLKALDKATNVCNIPLDSKHVEIRHNSPNVVDFFSSGQIYDLILNFQSIFSTLRPVIADLSAIITIGGAVGSTGKFIKNKIYNKNKKKSMSKSQTFSDDIVKLRKELNTIYKNKQYYTTFNIDNEGISFEKLNDIKKELKESNIVIEGLEVQFLNGKEDVLDILYDNYYQDN